MNIKTKFNNVDQSSVLVILINYNGSEDTIECVNSLKKINYRKFDILIIDNNSDNSQKELLLNELSDSCKIIELDNNVGFTGGNNIGMKYAISNLYDFALLLNNDTVVEPDFLKILLERFLIDPSIGISAPQINYFSEPKRVWSRGGTISKIRGSGFAKQGQLETNIKNNSRYVSFVSGCCMLIKKDVFEKVGLFDEKFFLYLEDTDFCFRTIKKGYNIYSCTNAKIYHKVGNSTKSNSNLPLYYTTRNRLYFAKKNFPEFFLLTFIYIFFTMALKSIIWVFTNNLNKVITVKKAFYDFFEKNLGKQILN